MTYIAGLITLSFLAPIATLGQAIEKTKFYRPRVPAGARPKAVGDAVVVNAASFEPGISPGSLCTVYGTNLTSISGQVVAGTIPLPTELAGVSILVNNIPAAMYSVAFANGSDVISFQVPFEVPTGPGAAAIEVFDHGDRTALLIADSFTEDPGIFVYNGNYAVAAATSDGSLIGPGNPAIVGETLALYTTGLGPLSFDVPDGFPGPSSPPASTIDPLSVILANEPCEVLFSGLAPGFVGVYQINFRVPLDAPPGNLQLQIQTPFANSAVAILPVR